MHILHEQGRSLPAPPPPFPSCAVLQVYFHCDQLLRGMYSVWLEVWLRFFSDNELLLIKVSLTTLRWGVLALTQCSALRIQQGPPPLCLCGKESRGGTPAVCLQAEDLFANTTAVMQRVLKVRGRGGRDAHRPVLSLSVYGWAGQC